MLARLCPIFVATLIVFGPETTRAGAQALYYRSVPIGERAIGLGGAYTGISEDPSATYYNPAGLMAGGRFALLGSLSSIVYLKQKVENAFEVNGMNHDLESSRTTALPHFIGTVVKFGKKAFGDHRYAIAYSSFDLARHRFSGSFTEIEPDGSVDLRLSRTYRMQWWGISFAMQVKKNLSLGISGFLSDQGFSYGEDIGLASGGTLEDDAVRVGGQSATSTTRLSYGIWSLVFRLGALYRVNSRWQVGVMFQPPGAPVGNDGSVFRRLTGDFTTGSTYFLYDKGGFNTRAPIPFELRAGVEYKIDSLTTLSTDFAITGPVRAREVFPSPSEVQAVNATLGTYFANSTKRRVTPNAAIGVEHLFGKVVVAGGFSTNISAAPNVPSTTTEYTPDQISTFSASLAIGVDTKGYRLTLGANGSFGRGDALAFTINPDAQATNYRRTKSNLSGVLLYIAGAVSVASRGAKQVQEKYKERKELKNGDADTSADADAER